MGKTLTEIALHAYGDTYEISHEKAMRIAVFAVRKAVLERAMEKTSALEAPFWDDMQPDERAANEGWNEALENVLAALQRLMEESHDTP